MGRTREEFLSMNELTVGPILRGNNIPLINDKKTSFAQGFDLAAEDVLYLKYFVNRSFFCFLFLLIFIYLGII